MKGYKGYKKKNSGFTLLETLVVVAIVVILLAFGIVSIIRYRDYLRITELDNMARSIYVAAQNRAVLLDNDRRFQTLVKGTGTSGGAACTEITTGSGKRWYIDSKDASTADLLEDLLPAGTIDPALREGRFYIVYEPDSASVTDVFYVEKQDYDLAADFSGGIAGALAELGADEKREDRMKNKPMVGWFGSNAAAPRGEKLSKPFVQVIIENGNELTVTVKYTMPDDLPSGETVTRKPSVTLEYGGKEIKLLYVDEAGAVMSPQFSRLTSETQLSDITNESIKSATYTWVLDSLYPLDGSKQFKQLGGLTDLGKDFTVTAGLELVLPDGTKSSGNAQDTNNSLFAKGSATAPSDPSDPPASDIDDYSDTALIANLRHLQNLDIAYSGVGAFITKAEQKNDIDDAGTLKGNKDNVISSGYEFKPIENENLTCYQDSRTRTVPEGDEFPFVPCFIKNLKVTAASAAGKESAGLFGKVGDDTAGSNFTFQNIRLDTPDIAGGSMYAGGLVGKGDKGTISFKNCQVIGGKVSGEYAGGLAGAVGTTGTDADACTAEFTGCTVGETGGEETAVEVIAGDEAAVEEAAGEKIAVEGTTCAGGLVGASVGGSFIKCKVSDAEVTGTGAGSMAGGLVGSARDTEFESPAADGDDGQGCSVREVAVTAKGYAGGLVGYNKWEKLDEIGFEHYKVENLTVESKESSAGGLIGCQEGGTVSFDACTIGTDKEAAATISIVGKENAGGLLGYTQGCKVAFDKCTIKNSGSAGIDAISVKGNIVGGLVGNTTSGTGAVTFTACSADKITLTGGASAGGLAGSTGNAVFNRSVEADSTISGKCTAGNIAVAAEQRAGGLVGHSTGGSFEKCEVFNATITTGGSETNSDGNISVSRAGGLVGETEAAGLEGGVGFSGCTVGKTADGTVTVTANGYAGGLAGVSGQGSFSGCEIVSAAVTSSGNAAGGLAGDTGAPKYTNCAVGGSHDGEIVGEVTVTAQNMAGGLAGSSWGGDAEGITLTDCKAISAAVTSNDGWSFAGGMVGYNQGSKMSFVNCGIEGLTVTNSNCGGLIGCKDGGSVSFSGCMVEDKTKPISISGSNIGGLVGYATSTCKSTFDGCTIQTQADGKGIEISGEKAGGLAGCIADAAFTGCGLKNTGNTGNSGISITGTAYAGGMLGYLMFDKGQTTGKAIFTNCTVENAGEPEKVVISANRAGGLAGDTTGSPERDEFKGCIVGGITVKGNDYAGGFVGVTGDAIFEPSGNGEEKTQNCVVKNIKVGILNDFVGTCAGGFAGQSGLSEFSNCVVEYSEIIAEKWAGGLTGDSWGETVNFQRCTASNSKITGTGWSCAGGMVGHNWESSLSFDRCGIEGLDVSAGNGAGGLVGNKGAGRIDFNKCVVGENGVGDITIRSGSQSGGLLGYADGGSTASFNNCSVRNPGHKVTIDGTLPGTTAGGLAGGTQNAYFIGCTVGREENESIDTNKSIDITIAGGNESGNAGGLVGFAGANGDEVQTTIIKDCRVCWTQSDRTALIDGSELKYKISASVAGGLVGKFEDCNGTIENSYAATLVDGKVYVGGLIGWINAPDQYNDEKKTEKIPLHSSVKISNSYADCYLKVGSEGSPVFWASAGGLIGMTQRNEITVNLENVYTAGFIQVLKAHSVGGLCSNWFSNAKVTNAYTAMDYEGDIRSAENNDKLDEVNPQKDKARICQTADGETEFTVTNCYYLNTFGHTNGKSYEEMKSINLGEAFVHSPETHPYGLSEYASTELPYPFPCLKYISSEGSGDPTQNLPHYGDWVSEDGANRISALEEDSEADELADLDEVLDGDVEPDGKIDTETGEPVNPEEPPDNSQPANPEEPPDSSQPANPEEPPDSSQPANPEEPPDNSQPANPEEPPDSSQPANPEEPPDNSQPTNPEEPPDNSNVSDGGEDSQPEKLPNLETPKGGSETAGGKAPPESDAVSNNTDNGSGGDAAAENMAAAGEADEEPPEGGNADDGGSGVP